MSNQRGQVIAFDPNDEVTSERITRHIVIALTEHREVTGYQIALLRQRIQAFVEPLVLREKDGERVSLDEFSEGITFIVHEVLNNGR